MRSLLETAVEVTGGGAELVWVDPAAIEAAGIHRWTELPGWVPPGDGYAGLHSTNVDRAFASGLRCRPVRETVADTWTWLRAAGGAPPPPPGQPPVGLDPAKEAAALATWRRSAP
jgi:2'-hydroxyisoflavone reductase